MRLYSSTLNYQISEVEPEYYRGWRRRIRCEIRSLTDGRGAEMALGAEEARFVVLGCRGKTGDSGSTLLGSEEPVAGEPGWT